MPTATARRLTVLLCLLPLALAGCGGQGTTLRDPAPIPPALQGELESWLAEHGRPPLDYVRGLFAAHDVVLLGEQHRIHHDPLRVQSLLPRLLADGVTVLATEFARRSDQALLDSLLSLPEWDEELAREIQFRQFAPWGYQEYVDVLRAAWRANEGRSPGSPALRVLGLNHTLDYGHIRSVEDWDDPAVWARVEGGQTEADWARVILDAVAAGRKVLVHCGIHHAFTDYRQPRVVDGAFAGWGRARCGNHVHEALGDRAATVYLHAPWPGSGGYGSPAVHPAGGALDAFMLAREGGPFAVGFDLAGSPLASLEVTDAVYAHGHAPFRPADFCDGWIYTCPVSAYEGVTYIRNWIHEGNLARAQADAMNPAMRTADAAEWNRICAADADLDRVRGNLR